jgi:hypothetical protein
VEGIVGQAPVTVTPVPVASVTVSLAASTINPGQSTSAGVVVRDAQGNTLIGRAITWSVSDMNVGLTPPASAWVDCGGQFALCAFNGTQQVRIGANGIYGYGQFTDGVTCQHQVIGGLDPIRGVLKSCQYASLTSTLSGNPGPQLTTVAAGNATLNATVEGVTGSVGFTVPDNVPMGWATILADGSLWDWRNLANGGVLAWRLGTGVYQVNFLEMANGILGNAFTFHVAATSQAPVLSLATGNASCGISGYGIFNAATVFVRCANIITGLLTDASFRVVVIGDNVLGGSHRAGIQNALMSRHDGGNSAEVPDPRVSWNSWGLPMTVTPVPGGGAVHVPGVQLQVPWIYFTTNALQPTAFITECNLTAASQAAAQVQCFDKTFGPLQAEHFLLGYERGRLNQPFGYVGVRNNAIQAVNTNASNVVDPTVTKKATGKYWITWNISLARDPAILLSAAINGVTFRQCAHWLQTLSPLTIEVACWDATGQFVDTNFNLGFLY